MGESMKKVLIISGNFFGYQDSVGRAFQRMGYDVRIEIFEGPVHPFRGWMKLKHKLAYDKEKVRHESRLNYDRHIKQVYDEYLPDIVFTYNGTILLDERLDYFRLRSKVILWMYDSVQRPVYKICHDHIDHVDAFFCFDRSDVAYFHGIGKTAFFLPLACDPQVYHPLTVEQDIDIVFIGAIYNSPKRTTLLEHLVEHYPDRKILIYGKYKPIEKNPLGWLFRTHRDVFRNINVAPSEVNRLYSRCKIALNIHNEQSDQSANQRFFESSGAGAYQICDINRFTKDFFPTDCIGLYETEEEMFRQIDWALDPANTNLRKERAENAMRFIQNGNTFEDRVREMLRNIEEMI